MSGRVRTLVVATAVAGAAITAVFAFTSTRFVYEAPDLRIVMETVQATIAGLVAFLLYGRFRRTGERRDLLLTFSLIVLAVNNLLFAMLPALVGDSRTSRVDRYETWIPMTLSSIAAVGLAIAAWMGRDRVRTARPGLALTSVSVVVLAAVMGVGALVASRLPVGVALRASAHQRPRPSIHAHPAVAFTQLALVAVFAVAAVGFTRRASGGGDRLISAMAIATTIAAYSRLNFFLYPSLYTDMVHVGDFLRLAYYLVLLSVAVEEIRIHFEGATHAATVRERERMARELHDGLTQELTFIRSQAASLAQGRGHPEMLNYVADAADRAYDESRRLLAALTDDTAVDLRESVYRAAADIAERAGATVEVFGATPGGLTPLAHGELVRIVREATVNAVRHGGASRIRIVLHGDGARLLSITDDGQGFDVAAVDGGGFGMRSMRSRASGLGADVVIRSAPGDGTTVELRRIAVAGP